MLVGSPLWLDATLRDSNGAELLPADVEAQGLQFSIKFFEKWNGGPLTDITERNTSSEGSNGFLQRHKADNEGSYEWTASCEKVGLKSANSESIRVA